MSYLIDWINRLIYDHTYNGPDPPMVAHPARGQMTKSRHRETTIIEEHLRVHMIKHNFEHVLYINSSARHRHRVYTNAMRPGAIYYRRKHTSMKVYPSPAIIAPVVPAYHGQLIQMPQTQDNNAAQLH